MMEVFLDFSIVWWYAFSLKNTICIRFQELPVDLSADKGNVYILYGSR
jgi:hypothetical protein